MTPQQIVEQITALGFSLGLNPKTQQLLIKPRYPGARLPQQLQAALEQQSVQVSAFLSKPRTWKDASEEWSERCTACECWVFRAVLICGCSLVQEKVIQRCPYGQRG